MAPKTNSFRSLIAASGQAPVPGSDAEKTTESPLTKVRPSGKRKAPDFVQVGIYLPKQLHRKAKVALLHEKEDRDFSELMADLLAEHLGKSA